MRQQALTGRLPLSFPANAQFRSISVDGVDPVWVQMLPQLAAPQFGVFLESGDATNGELFIGGYDAAHIVGGAKALVQVPVSTPGVAGGVAVGGLRLLHPACAHGPPILLTPYCPATRRSHPRRTGRCRCWA